MKKTILAVLMVALITTPCLAQEVETDGSSTIEGTLWDADRNSQYWGFYEGQIYIVWYFEDSPNVPCSVFPGSMSSFSFYFDFLSFSIAYMQWAFSDLSGISVDGAFHIGHRFMVLLPQQSIGWERGCLTPPHTPYRCRNYDLTMTSDNWSTAECTEIN